MDMITNFDQLFESPLIKQCINKQKLLANFKFTEDILATHFTDKSLIPLILSKQTHVSETYIHYIVSKSDYYPNYMYKYYFKAKPDYSYQFLLDAHDMARQKHDCLIPNWAYSEYVNEAYLKRIITERNDLTDGIIIGSGHKLSTEFIKWVLDTDPKVIVRWDDFYRAPPPMIKLIGHKLSPEITQHHLENHLDCNTKSILKYATQLTSDGITSAVVKFTRAPLYESQKKHIISIIKDSRVDWDKVSECATMQPWFVEMCDKYLNYEIAFKNRSFNVKGYTNVVVPRLYKSHAYKVATLNEF